MPKPSSAPGMEPPTSEWGSLAFRYPKLGDEIPAGGQTVTLLTKGGVAVSGSWSDDGRYVGWAPTPVRDRTKEKRLRDLGVVI